MSHRVLAQPLTAYRIGDPSGIYPIWSSAGAFLRGGRWHEAGDPVVYASEHYATAMLEKLAYAQGELPPNQHYVEVTIPSGVTYEVFADHQARDWRLPGSPGAATFGHEWAASLRSALLIVPSAIAPIERNFIFNSRHPDFARISVGLETPVWWDERLFGN